jgi:hypothetical protein
MKLQQHPSKTVARRQIGTLLQCIGVLCAGTLVCQFQLYVAWSHMEESDTRIVGNSFDKYSSVVGFPETTLKCANRLDKQWKWWSTPKYSPVSDITGPSASRVFLSSFPHVVQDGVGHMSEIISWELKAARLLRARYTHRDAYYSSLGASVDDFFRWGTQAEGRSVFLSKICNKTEFVIDACRGNRTRCAGLKSSARPFVKLVDVPVAMIHCALRSSSPKQLSRCKLDTFLERHDGDGIVFQLDTDTCYWRNSARWEFPELVRLADSYWSRKHDTFRMGHSVFQFFNQWPISTVFGRGDCQHDLRNYFCCRGCGIAPEAGVRGSHIFPRCKKEGSQCAGSP